MDRLKKPRQSDAAGLTVISRIAMKRLARRAFWKGAMATHPDLTIPVEEVDRLNKFFDAWWKGQS